MSTPVRKILIGMLILLLLDVISITLFNQALPRILGVVIVLTVAILAVAAIGKLAFKRDAGS